MIKKKVMVVSESGLHARPANILLKNAQKFDCDVEIAVDNKLFNAKSIIGILAAGVNCGTEIEVVCSGSDENEACDALVKLISDGLGD